jgi:hypothetical protein
MLRQRNDGSVAERDVKIEWLKPGDRFCRSLGHGMTRSCNSQFSSMPIVGRGCNWVQGATALLAFTATVAM